MKQKDGKWEKKFKNKTKNEKQYDFVFLPPNSCCWPWSEPHSPHNVHQSGSSKTTGSSPSHSWQSRWMVELTALETRQTTQWQRIPLILGEENKPELGIVFCSMFKIINPNYFTDAPVGVNISHWILNHASQCYVAPQIINTPFCFSWCVVTKVLLPCDSRVWNVWNLLPSRSS